MELPVERMLSADAGPRPVPNAAFAPGPDALQAPAFTGTLTIGSSPLLAQPELRTPVLEGRDARVFPGITLSFVSDGATLIPVERGEMVRETAPGAVRVTGASFRSLGASGAKPLTAAGRERRFR